MVDILVIILAIILMVYPTNAPSGPDQWSRAMDRSKLKLYKWFTVRPESELVRTIGRRLLPSQFQVDCQRY